MERFLKFVVSMVASYLPGAAGAKFTPSANPDSIYESLNKSVLNPPGYVFGIVWNIIFFMLGYALFRVLDSDVKNKKPAIGLFIAHMFFNGIWSFIFFGLQLYGLALINIFILIIIAVFMQREFAKHSRVAGYLILPYLIWLLFAMYLNWSIIVLN